MIKFLNCTLNVIITDEDDCKSGKTGDLEYTVYLSKNCEIPIIVHELWHIFMDSLIDFDNGTLNCSELSTDIYAYTFENLLREILDFLKYN